MVNWAKTVPNKHLEIFENLSARPKTDIIIESLKIILRSVCFFNTFGTEALVLSFLSLGWRVKVESSEIFFIRF